MNIPKLTSYLRQLSISGDLNQAELVRTVIETAPQSNYQSYVVKFTPTNTINPNIIVFNNTMLGTLTWSTSGAGAGDWYLTSSAFSFTDQNTFIQIDKGQFVSTPLPTPGEYANIFAFVGSGEHAGKLRINYYGAQLTWPIFLEVRVYP